MKARSEEHESTHGASDGLEAFRRNNDVRVERTGTVTVSEHAILSSENVRKDFDLLSKLCHDGVI